VSDRSVGDTPLTVELPRRRPGPIAVTLPCGRYSVQPTSTIDPLVWLYVPLLPPSLIAAGADYLAGGLSRVAPDHFAAACRDGRPTTVDMQAHMVMGLGSGPRIRVASHGATGRFLVGRLGSVTSDSLTIHTPPPGGALTLHRAAIRELQLSRGYHRSTGTLIGAGVGGALGVALGVLLSNEPFAPLSGALVGVPLGMIIGHRLAPERWQRLIP
jgi:hypothetical protein